MAPLRSDNGTILSNGADKAEALNAYFAYVFTPITIGSYSSDKLSPHISVSQPVDFSLKSVLSALRQAKHTISSGPDSIPSIFWSKLASVLAFTISIIFNASYKSLKLPDDWNHVLVGQVFKKDDVSVVNNLACQSKIMCY